MTRLLAATALAALSIAVPAAAQTAPATPPPSSAPEPRCGTAFTDPAADNNSVQGDVDSGDVNLDVLAGWFDYDRKLGDKGLTANLRVSDLSKRMFQVSTGVVWNVNYEAGGKNRFVRALVDFSGGPYYEYGVVLPALTTENPLPTPRYAYEGTTTGKLVEGKNGVVQIVVPKAAGGEEGKELKNAWSTTASSRQAVPGSVTQAPTRGLSSTVDTAPNDATPTGGTKGSAFTVNDCSPLDHLKDEAVVEKVEKAAPPAPAPAPATSPAPPSPTPAPIATYATPSVTLLTTTARRLRKGKVLALRMRSSVPLVGVAVQLRRGRTSLGYARLARLPGTGTLKLKLTRPLKKGTYMLDIAASSEENGRVLTAAKVTVR
jgi:hypothetical protein